MGGCSGQGPGIELRAENPANKGRNKGPVHKGQQDYRSKNERRITGDTR